jgi:rhodanese-related sulfurtransferase
MKKPLFFSFLIVLLSLSASAQNPVNWTKDELMEPAALAAILANGKDVPVILSVGPGATIPQSKHIGMTNEDANLASLKKSLAALPKTQPVVIYCGCCPFEHCPNVRPAIAVLKELQFANYKLLNLPKNLKTDWIDKGYPTVKQ